MNRSGCKNCPVKPCETLYRGSICLSRRHKLGLGDPMTTADRIRAMTDEELAVLIAREIVHVPHSGFYVAKSAWLRWLHETVEEQDG